MDVAASAVEVQLADYILALNRGREQTLHSSERPLYTAHLAEAALMAAALMRQDKAEMRLLVESERQRFGRSFLSGAVGEQVSSMFERMSASVKTGAV